MSRLSCAVLVLTLMASSAMAESAMIRQNTQIFDGPAGQFATIGVVPGGTEVELIGCSNGWCEIELGDQEGFVPQQVLDFSGPLPIVEFPPVVYQYGWRYWRERQGGEWEQWRRRYGHSPGRSYVTPRGPGGPPHPQPGGPGLRPGGPGMEPGGPRPGDMGGPPMPGGMPPR